MQNFTVGGVLFGFNFRTNEIKANFSFKSTCSSAMIDSVNVNVVYVFFIITGADVVGINVTILFFVS